LAWPKLEPSRQRADMTYEELAERLIVQGILETRASISNKLARATLTAHFYLASLAAIGKDGVSLEDI
jgi:hypothetical protein